jgi:DsbC/DsbD-like thiol-disulfide interchange protein
MRLFAAFFFACFAAFALAQGAPEPKIDLKLDAKTAAPGAKLKGKVIVTFAAGWHGYQNPPKHDYEIPLKIESATKGMLVQATYPKGILKPFAGQPTLMYEGTVTIPVVLTLPKTSGSFNASLLVKYQQCDEESCLPPSEQKVSAKLTLRAAAPAAKSAAKKAPAKKVAAKTPQCGCKKPKG